jgi:hypothetical protein
MHIPYEHSPIVTGLLKSKRRKTMMDFLFSPHSLSRSFSADDSQNVQAFLGRSHKNKSQPKKLMPRRRSDEKKYSEWAENDSLGSVNPSQKTTHCAVRNKKKKGSKEEEQNLSIL